jgi:outer membrane protein OmpA-like peptidoglycan-associated protein
MKRSLPGIVLVGCLVWMPVVWAAEPDSTLDAATIAEGLLGQAPSGDRGIGVAARPMPPAARPNAVSLNIHFELNSAKLLADAAPQLDALWQALTLSELRGKQVEISGHTDSRGDDSYNLKLSQQRAATVRDYLLSKGRLVAQRLRATGVGEQEPLPGTAPEDPSNRRVEVRLLTIE